MTTRFCRFGAIGAGILFVAACSSPAPEQPAQAPAATGPTAPVAAKPEVSINAVMVALVDHAAHNLWAVEGEGRAPKTDQDWLVVEEHAVQVAASGPAITVGGTGPRDSVWVVTPSWQGHAQRMSDAGVAALNAARDRNLTALVAANGQLVESCESCHKEFKPDLPSEGIVHTHAH